MFALSALLVVTAAGIALPGGTAADQASEPASVAARQLDAGRVHTCVLLPGGRVRCWGFNREGELGYGNTSTIGDDETPGAPEPVNLGAGRAAVSISAGDYHSCAVLDSGTVRCWGFGRNGRLGYGNQDNIGDNEAPGSVPPVDLGPERTAKSVAAGGAHTCAILADDTVRCWGYGFYGQLGYGNPDPDPATPTIEPNPLNIGDDEAPGSVGPVNLGDGRTAKAITAGDLHTCAILDNDAVRCWGNGANGQLGYGNQSNVGDRDTPASAGPVDLGTDRTATAIAAGASQTCAVLDDGRVRCWGFGGNGRLGNGNGNTIGDNETPGSVPAVDLGTGRTAKAIGVGDGHACALLDNDNVRCWGFNIDGRLGYGNKADIGDNETPGSVGPVDLGTSRSGRAIALGGRHTCARLDDASVRCWGYGGNGRLGYCNANDIGDDEAPGSVGPVNVTGPAACPAAAAPPGAGGGGVAPAPGGYPLPAAPPRLVKRPLSQAEVYRRALAAQARRKRALVGCYTRVQRHAGREQRRVGRRGSAARRARAKRHIKRHRAQGRRACRKRFGRTPGRVTDLKARAVSKSRVALSFSAAGTDRDKPPAARGYVIKQSRRPIRTSRDFARAQTLCRGQCRFKVSLIGAPATLTITDLRPHTTYYYAVAARDNVSRRLGRRSRPARAKTR